MSKNLWPHFEKSYNINDPIAKKYFFDFFFKTNGAEIIFDMLRI